MRRDFFCRSPILLWAAGLLWVAGLAFLAGCSDQDRPAAPVPDTLSAGLMLSSEMAVMVRFVDRHGSDAGEVLAIHSPNGVLFRVGAKRLSEGWHGIHLHQKGDCSDAAAGFKASGGHIDPEDNDHGLLSIVGYEAADMPNIYANLYGWAYGAFFNPGLRLFPSEENAASGAAILLDDDGFAVIIHENPDDHLTQPIGGAGARLVCAAFIPENTIAEPVQ